jgi:hypothetical protein
MNLTLECTSSKVKSSRGQNRSHTIYANGMAQKNRTQASVMRAVL